MNDIFLIKPPPPVTKVIWKFFDTPDGINFYAATFCCYESCNPEYRWKFLLFHQTNNYTDTIVTTATLPMMMIPIGILSFFQWIQWYFRLCFFFKSLSKYLSNRYNLYVFRNSNWNEHFWESLSHKWYLHKNKSESPNDLEHN